MPEILEAEKARELIEARALGREIASVHAPDAWFLKRGLTPDAAEAALPGHRFTDARRRGKLLLLDTDADGPTLALHLGMSGRVVIDGEAAGDPLLYAANGDNPAWLRFGVTFADGGSLYLRDPRRLGAAELDPDEDRLGVDAFALRLPLLRKQVAASRAPIKAMLMDQSRIAGLGNLLTDEALFRAGIDPARPANTLSDDEVKALAQRDLHHAAGAAAPGRLAHRRPHARRASRAATARATAPSSCAGPSAAAPPTPARSTSSSAPAESAHPPLTSDLPYCAGGHGRFAPLGENPAGGHDHPYHQARQVGREDQPKDRGDARGYRWVGASPAPAPVPTSGPRARRDPPRVSGLRAAPAVPRGRGVPHRSRSRSPSSAPTGPPTTPRTSSPATRPSASRTARSGRSRSRRCCSRTCG